MSPASTTAVLRAFTSNPLSATDDRCDRCGARAAVYVTMRSDLEVLLCGHHFHEHRPVLLEQAREIADYTAAIN